MPIVSEEQPVLSVIRAISAAIDKYKYRKNVKDRMPKRVARPNPASVGRPKRQSAIDVKDKDYFQSVGVSVLPVEDFYPGCIVAVGQMLPGDLDVAKIKEAARVGLRNPAIAALVGTREDTLVKHFGKTIARERAQRAMDLLGHLNLRADDSEAGKQHDFQSIVELLDRQDPAPPKEVRTAITIQPLPAEIFELQPEELTKQLQSAKQLEYKKETE